MTGLESILAQITGDAAQEAEKLLAQGRQESGALAVPLWLLVLCALTMALGTCLGGRRIIDRVGREMVSLDPRQGCRADVPDARPAWYGG